MLFPPRQGLRPTPQQARTCAAVCLPAHEPGSATLRIWSLARSLKIRVTRYAPSNCRACLSAQATHGGTSCGGFRSGRAPDRLRESDVQAAKSVQRSPTTIRHSHHVRHLFHSLRSTGVRRDPVTHSRHGCVRTIGIAPTAFQLRYGRTWRRSAGRSGLALRFACRLLSCAGASGRSGGDGWLARARCHGR